LAGRGGIVWGDTTGENEGDLRVGFGKVAGERPVEGFAGAAVVGAGGGVDEEGEVLFGEFVVGKVEGADGADDGDVLVEEEVDVLKGFVAVELDDVDEALIDEVGREGAGVVDEDADAEDVACDMGGDGGGMLWRAVAFRWGPEVDAHRGDTKFGELYGVVEMGHATDFQRGLRGKEFVEHREGERSKRRREIELLRKIYWGVLIGES